MNRLGWFTIVFALALVIISASNKQPGPPRGMQMFSTAAMKAHDRFLASDLLEGRGPGTRGDDLAMQYIAAQFESYGLTPAGDNGTFFQRVPLLGVTMDAASTSLS